MSEQKSTLVQFRPGALSAALAERGSSAGAVAKRDLERYYRLIQQCLAEVNFSFAEALTVAEALKTIPLDWRAIEYIGPIVNKTIQYERGTYIKALVNLLSPDYWESYPDVDESQLLDIDFLNQKILNLDVSQSFAVYDAVERYAELEKPENLISPVELDGEMLQADGEDESGEGIRICTRLIWSGLWKPPYGYITKVFQSRWFSSIEKLMWQKRREQFRDKEAIEGVTLAPRSIKAPDQQSNINGAHA
jgi:hypothetical protein